MMNRPILSTIGCLASFMLLVGSSSASWGYSAREGTETNETVQIAQIPARKISNNLTILHSSSSIVQEGFDAAISSGEIEQAFEHWVNFMPSELADQFRSEPSSVSLIASFLKPMGQWQSYDLIGTITLASSEFPVRSQIIYVELSTETTPIFWEFILVEFPDGWKIINFNLNSDRDALIQGLFLMLLGLDE